MGVDSTGTPSTNYSIPKFLTSADAPSGKGGNAIVDYIDNLLKTGFTEKPSGIVSGEVPVWNGSAWVRSSATNIGPTSLGSGTPDATKFLRGDGSWQSVPTASGTELAYVELTSQVSVVSTTESAGTLIIDLGSVTFDGSAVILEFFAPNYIVQPASGGGAMLLSLFEGSTQIGRLGIGQIIVPSVTAAYAHPFFVRRKFTPSAGAHDYKLTAYINSGSGGVIGGLGGGTNTYLPAYARITKA